MDIVADQAGLFLGDVTLSHRHQAIFQLPFGRSFDQLIDSTLGLIADLLMAAFLANGAGDVTDLKQVGLYRGPAQVGLRSTLCAFPRHAFF